jgi:hypothetical protein
MTAINGGTLSELAVQVSGYFRDFLESDFKRSAAPRRRVMLQSDAGFRCGMRSRPYGSLDRALWDLISQASGSAQSINIAPRQHTRSISTTLRKVIDEQVQAIPEDALQRIRQALLVDIEATKPLADKDPEAWIEGAITRLHTEINERIVRPLVQRLDEPLRRSSYDFIDSLYATEQDLVRAAAQPLQAVLADALAKYLARPENGELAEALSTHLELQGIKDALMAVFDGLVTADAFLEIRDIDTYVAVNEGHALYLYLGSLKLRTAAYPVFFVPVELKKLDNGRGFELKLVNQLFANRAAVEFVLQELAAAKNRDWVNPLHERILYLASEQSILEVARGLYAAVAASLGLGGKTQLSSHSTDAAGVDVALSPALHLCAFERGEESVINDYEEIITMARQGGGAIVDLFEKLVEGIITSNPVSIARGVEQEWDGLPLVERMVFDSPIPLNEEQRKILLAVRNPEGPIVVVEGPPGTGKSHTIVALAADCAFNQKSCLVLSDKAEALQVVHDKLSEAMSRVRHVQDFPNPLLRLGKQDANFKRLVGNQTVSQISAYAKASTRNLPDLKNERDAETVQLRESIDTTVQVLGSISLAEVQRLHAIEDQLREQLPEALRAIHTFVPDSDSKPLVSALRKSLSAATSGQDDPTQSLDAYMAMLQEELADTGEPFNPTSLRQRVRVDLALAGVAKILGGSRLSAMSMFSRLTIAQARDIQNAVLRYRQLKLPLLGYLFRGSAVRELEAQLNSLPVKEPVLLKEQAVQLVEAARAALEIHEALEQVGAAEQLPRLWAKTAKAASLEATANSLSTALALFARVHGLPEAMQSPVATQRASLWRLVVECLVSWVEVREAFATAPTYDYVGTKSKIERLNTSLMNAHVDSRLVDFIDNHRADAKTMAQLIADRQKFPEEKFGAVRSSFPIIIAGIREFGEYMPLAPALFDVVIIDEASQVSVAQALPALLRAKKVVVLGDSKQFASVKSANASIALNDKYRSNLVQFFEREVTREAEALKRLAMFDVKRSVLDFCSMAASYSVMLRKHFRSYPELISYSSKTFYGNQLQALKIRARPIDEVIRFEKVNPTDKKVTRATNEAEVEVIVQRLEEFLELDVPPTVGVITPFREQHTLMQKTLFGHPRAQEFESALKLKVMTFDSCQGEERQIIFYSLVATPGNDALNYIFPTALENAQESVEEKLKVQRLNVGFSRAQECIWILHSQEIGLYKGALAQALHHYQGVLRRKAPDKSQTDAASPMEAKVLEWLQATQFVQGQPDEVEVLPQFPISEYLQQLDPTYQHPAWRVDFLLVCRTPKINLNIVVEYDGFEYHFDRENASKVNVGSHERYLKDADVERQLTLESYGYRFLRINRFNIGTDPVATLDARLAKLVELATGEQSSVFVERLRTQAAGITSREMKSCSRCQAILPQARFFDQTLKAGQGGYGRVCMDCKAKARTAARSWR